MLRFTWPENYDLQMELRGIEARREKIFPPPSVTENTSATFQNAPNLEHDWRDERRSFSLLFTIPAVHFMANSEDEVSSFMVARWL